MVEDIFVRLAGGKVLTKLNPSQVYLHLPVDKDSRALLVINTPKGLFRYNHLAYGVSVAPAIFQSVMDCVLIGLPVACYLDDILIAAPTEQEHNVILETGYKRAEYIYEKRNVNLLSRMSHSQEPLWDYLIIVANSSHRLLATLYKLLEKDSKWAWTKECNATFKTCKDLLESKAMLIMIP